MTNEELMRAYYYDPENSVEIMHQLLEQNMGLIYSIAERLPPNSTAWNLRATASTPSTPKPSWTNWWMRAF